MRLVAVAALWLLVACGGPASGPTGDGSEAVDTDTLGPAVTEDPGGVETGAEGGVGGISIEVAGLPVGASGSLDLAGVWCFPIFWSETGAEGASVTIDSVEIAEAGATLHQDPCGDQPPCVGATLVDGNGSCSLLVTPPSPDAASVSVRIDATVRCEVQADCDAVQGADGWTLLESPSGGDAPETSEATTPTGEPTDQPTDQPTDEPTDAPDDETTTDGG